MAAVKVLVVPAGPGRWVFGRESDDGEFVRAGELRAVPSGGLEADRDGDGLYVTALCMLGRQRTETPIAYDLEIAAPTARAEGPTGASWRRSTSVKAKAAGWTLADRAAKATPPDRR